MALSKELQIGKAGEHIVCADLILKGYNAFLADQGLPFDVIVEKSGKVWRLQVRATLGPKNYRHVSPKYKDGKRYYFDRSIYRFQTRVGRGANRRIEIGAVDVFAFVALDIKVVAYMSVADHMITAKGLITGIEFSTSDQSPNRKVKTWGRRMGNFLEFPE